MMMRRRGAPLLRAAATTAVVAGTAGAVRHHQEQKYATQAEEFKRRINQQVMLLDDYRGEAFLQKVDGGQRLYKLAAQKLVERAQNRWLMFIGALLAFSGIIGFVVEQRLRSVKL